MSGFTTINKPVVPGHVVKPLDIAWPVTGTVSTYEGGTTTYTIFGGGNVPSYITFASDPGENFYFSLFTGSGLYVADIENSKAYRIGVTMGILSTGGYAVNFVGVR